MPEPDDRLITRDYLALDRTKLANERTLLAYARTAVAFAAAGATVIKFIRGDWATVSGWVLIVLGVITAVFGAWSFLRMRNRLNDVDSYGRPPGAKGA